MNQAHETHSTKKKPHKKGSMMRLAALMAPQWKWLVLCALCVVVVNSAELFKPYVMKMVIDEFLIKGNVGSGLFSITGLSVSYFLVVALGSAATIAQVYLISRVGQRILHELRISVFAHIHRMPLKKLDAFTSGRLLTRATNDVETLNEFYSDVVVGLFRDIFLLIGIVSVMLFMDVRLALVAFCTVPLIVVLTLSLRKKLRTNFQLMKSITGAINGFFAENISGMRLVQAFNRQKQKLKQFQKLNDDYFKSALFQVIMNGLLRPAMEVINSLSIALLLWFGYSRMTGGLLELGVLYAFTNYIKQFFEPINDLAEKYTTVQSALVSAERIYELLDDTEDQEDFSLGSHGGKVKGKVEFRDVWFSYVPDEWVLKGVNFTAHVGEKIAFVGSTGAGKSTIIQLISGFYIPQKGEILIDDVPLSQWKLGDLRTGIAVVLQDVFLFAGDIMENVTLGAKLGEEAARAALEQAAAWPFVSALPGGLSAPVTERGSTFSVGERQLLSFARAIVTNPAILVLDEATAHIDSQTEQLIQTSIANISKERTSIFIAHRLSTIRNCSSILVLEDGVIGEKGTHDELVAMNGKYCALYRAQLETEEVA